MEVKFLDLKKNYLSIKDELNNEFYSLFENCDFIGGCKVKEFENNFASYISTKHFISCGNGTDALEIAVSSLNLCENDEIIVQGNTYIATCLGVVNNNVKLVLCDCDENYMIDINKIQEKITVNTKAVIVVHLYGFVPNMDKILDICKNNNLFLIEDCAQAHGATWNGKKVGSFGILSCFSFYPGKNLGAYGDGGGIGTNNDELNEKIRKICNIGCKKKYYHELIGRNSRLDTIQAKVLNIKLKYLDKWNEQRRQNSKIYIENLIDNNNIILPKIIENCSPVYHLFVIRTKYRNELQNYLSEKKIHTLIHYPISISETEALSNKKFTDLENCKFFSNEILSLPMYPELTEEEIIYVCKNINNFFLEKNLLKLTGVITENKPGILHYLNNFNFDVKRFFYIENFSDNNCRGNHSNINFEEVIIVINGNLNLNLTDKNLEKKNIFLAKNEIFNVPRNSWITFNTEDKTTIIFVLANEILSKSTGIHCYDDFIKYNSEST